MEPNSPQSTPNLPPIPPKPVETKPSSETHPHTTMWDTFEHILMFISLYILATSIALMLYIFVDKWVPSTLEGNSAFSYFNASLARGYLAAIIVSYPFFAYLFLRITKRTKTNISIKNLGARKTLIYFTLVVTFLISIGNVISAVYSFLNGNISLNFVLKLFVTLSISLLIFFYYVSQVKDDRKYV